MIHYGRQYINDDDIRQVAEALQSDYLTTGPKVGEFEEEICRVTGAKYAVAVSNGTAALHLACLAADIRQGDEVITTPMTFAASANAVLYCGGTPVFADINRSTWNIDPIEIERKITDRTKAIIPVHYMGSPCEMNAIRKLAEKYHLTIIEDAAHALGSSYKGKPIGSIGDMTTFSFHPVKTITTGEGGAITTNDENLYLKLKQLRTHGIIRSEALSEAEGPWFYNQTVLGYNYRITDFQCALGISQLRKLPFFKEKRDELVTQYDRLFEGVKWVVRPEIHEDSLLHIYVVRLRSDLIRINRRTIYERMVQEGILVNVHYIPVYWHGYYQDLGYHKGLCTEAEELYREMLTLPLHPGMTHLDIDYVYNKLVEIVSPHIQ